MDPAESEGKSAARSDAPWRVSPRALPRPGPRTSSSSRATAAGLRRSWPSTTRSMPSTAQSRRPLRRSASDGRAGVVWHTQGAGKSYTMAFYASKVRRDPRFENPTIVALTDRTRSRRPAPSDLRAQSRLGRRRRAGRVDRGDLRAFSAARVSSRRDRLHDDPEVRRPGARRDAGALGALERHRDG